MGILKSTQHTNINLTRSTSDPESSVLMQMDVLRNETNKARRQKRVVTEACLLQHLANVFNYLHVTLNHTEDICFLSLIDFVTATV